MDLLFNAPCESNTGTVCLWFHCSIPTVSLNKSVFLLLQYGVHDLLPWNQTVCLFWQAASYCSYGMHFTVMPGMLSLQLESHVITPGQHWTFQISQKHSTLNQHSTTVWFTLLMSNMLHPPRHCLSTSGLQRRGRGLEPIPPSKGQEMGYILVRSLISHKANRETDNYSHSHLHYGQLT